MKQITAVVVGYGNRGQVYADYSLDCPNQLKIVGIVDPNAYKLKEARERYALLENQVFTDLDAFLATKTQCDIVINATMDQTHYETALKILQAGYDMLIEKPIVSNNEQLMEIKKAADKNGCKVFVCHVLRYTPFYRRIKSLINAGEIGEIMTMEMNEHVCMSHYLTSYDRGKWNSETACGSGFLLAKSCHDVDLMCWLNNASAPERVASFGNRSQFTEKKRPEGAAEFCYDCPHVETCPYSAKRQYMYMGVMPFLVWDKLNKPLDEITEAEKEEFLKKDNYGRCAYIAGGDLVDRQNMIVTFENGSSCTFTLVGGTTIAGRWLHIIGTMGEIQGRLEDNKFILRQYTYDTFDGKVTEIDVSEEVVNNAKFGGHSGGDFAIMHDLIAYLNGDKSSVSITSLEDSVNGHMCVYAAEKSRKENKIVTLSEIM